MTPPSTSTSLPLMNPPSGMRRDDQLSNETMNGILRELDLEESRLET